jgi:hypothetical protein
MHKPAKTLIPSPTRSRRGSLPEVDDIETLIGQARALRLELTRLEACESLSESARAAIEALTQAGLSLERIAELLVSARSRKRQHRKTAQPILPNMEKELP